MEDLDSRRQRSSSLPPIGTFSSSQVKKMKREAAATMMFSFQKKKSSSTELAFIKLLVDSFWLKLDPKRTRRLSKSFPRASFLSAPNMAQRASTSAAAISTWVSSSEKTK